MVAPESNPFQPPSSDIGTDRPSDPYRWRVRFLIGALTVQLAAGLVVFGSALVLGLGWRASAIVMGLHALPPAAAIVQLARDAPIGILFAFGCGGLVMILHGDKPELGIPARVLGLSILALSFWVGRARGLFKWARS